MCGRSAPDSSFARFRSTLSQPSQVAATLFAVLFAGLALVVPLGPLAFAVRGLSPATVAVAASLAAVAKVCVPLLVGPWADRYGRHKILFWASLAAIMAAVSLALARHPMTMLLGYTLYVSASSAQMPLVDVLAYEAVSPRTERFAWLRVWGSIGFTLALILAGSASLPSHPFTLFMVTASLQVFALLVVSFGLAEDRGSSETSSSSILTDVYRCARTAKLELFLLATMLNFCGFGVYDSFYSLRLQALGYDDFFIGVAIAVGVAVEIVMMLVAPRYVAKLGAEGAQWLAFGGAVSAAVRWIVIAVSDKPWAFLMVQPLHALSFGLWFLGVVAHVQGRAEGHTKARLQSAAVAAIGTGGLLGSSLGGVLVARFGLSYGFVLGTITSIISAGLYLRLGVERLRQDGGRI